MDYIHYYKLSMNIVLWIIIIELKNRHRNRKINTMNHQMEFELIVNFDSK